MGEIDRTEEESKLDINEWIRLNQDKEYTTENEITNQKMKYLEEGDWI
jgi:hypothetical protein